MQRVKVLFCLGLWVAVVPYLGFPYFWRNLLLSLSGLFLTTIAYLMYRESKKQERTIFDNFKENSWSENIDILEKQVKELINE